MSRMIDRFRAFGTSLFDYRAQTMRYTPWAHFAAQLSAGYEVVAIDNVAEFFLAEHPQEVWDLEADFPNLAPPFSPFWMEYRPPSRIYSAECGIQAAPPIWTGALFHAFDLTADTIPDSTVLRPGAWQLLQPLCRAHGIRWAYNIGLFFEKHKGQPLVGPTAVALLFLQGDGTPVPRAVHDQLLGRPDGLADEAPISFLTAIPPEALPGEQREYFTGELCARLYPCFFALSLMHCKNTELIRHDPASAPKRSATRRTYRGAPRFTYSTLDIHPMRQVLKKQGGSDTHGLKRALHICRGHFKDYRGQGLFGKYKGLYWWDAHVRGAVASGIALKDYAVHPTGRPTHEEPTGNGL